MTNGKHIPPSHTSRVFTNSAKWVSVSHCVACDLKAAREDFHPVSPCPECGGKLTERVGTWIVETKRVFFGLFKVKTNAYWKLKDKPIEYTK